MDFDSREATAPDISFVVPSYQSESTIEMTLGSILGQESSLSSEIVVVDSSPGGLPAALETRYPELQVVQSSHRLWPGAARNLGAGPGSRPLACLRRRRCGCGEGLAGMPLRKAPDRPPTGW